MGWASGSLIGSRHILTAAHNLFKPEVRRARRITAFPAYSSDARPEHGGSEVSNGFYPSAYALPGGDVDRSWDIGVLALQSSVTLNKYFVPTLVSHNSEPSKRLEVAGYPGAHRYEMWKDDDEDWSGLNIADHIMSFNHYALPGSSGAPIFRTFHAIQQYAVLIGIDGEHEDKLGVLITDVTNYFITLAKQHADSHNFVVEIRV